MHDARLFPATAMPDPDWWHTLWPDPASVLAAVGITAGMDVVDLCCGDGYFTRLMCERVQSGKVWALDLDRDLLDQTVQACAAYPNLHPVFGDALQSLDQLHIAVDFVFMANTFHGVADKTGLSTAVRKVLRQGGRFAVINWHRRPREETIVLGQPRGPDTELRMRPAEVRQAVEPAGFQFEKTVDVGPYHYAAIFMPSMPNPVRKT